MITNQFCRTRGFYFPRPMNGETMTPSGRVPWGRTPARGVFRRIARSPFAADVRANPEIVGFLLAAAIGIAIGFLTRGMAWV